MQNRPLRNMNISAAASRAGGYAKPVDSATAANVLKNTYWLLALTLSFSAFTAYLSMGMPLNPVIHFGALIGALVISFIINKVADSGWGIALAFAFTGLLGLTIGPIVGFYVSVGAASTVTTALGLTAFAFFGLSGFALMSKKDFSFLSSFLAVGFWVIVGAFVISLFVQTSAFALAISAAIVLFASAAILYETSAIVHGGQTNYILAAVSLYASIYNLFMSLLHLLAFSSNE